MAFLQETPRSLRVYLLLVGVLGTAAQFYAILSPEGGALGRLLSLIGLAVSVAYVWLGISLRSLLSTAPRRVEQVLIAGAVYSILLAFIVGVLSPESQERGSAIARGIVGLLITLYLLRNVRRLARDAQAASGASTDAR